MNTRRMSFPILVALACHVAACDGSSKTAPDAETPAANGAAKLDPAVEYQLESMKKTIDSVQKKMEAKEPVKTACAGSMAHAEKLHQHEVEEVAKTAQRIKELCGLEAPQHDAKLAAAAIQAIRTEKPDAKFMRDCAQLKVARDTLEQHGHAEASAEFAEMYTAACAP